VCVCVCVCALYGGGQLLKVFHHSVDGTILIRRELLDVDISPPIQDYYFSESDPTSAMRHRHAT